jgi:cyanate permease
MSAAADEPALAAGRVSVVASIGYVAFLAGPPLIGFLGDDMGVLRALTSVAVLLALAALIATSVRPPAAARDAGTAPAPVRDLAPDPVA